MTSSETTHDIGFGVAGRALSADRRGQFCNRQGLGHLGSGDLHHRRTRHALYGRMGSLREVRHPRDGCKDRGASRRAGHQRRDRRGQVNPPTTGVVMRKLVAATAVVSSLALAGCQTASLPSLNLNTAVTLNTIYGIENAYGVAVNAANAYKALPLCRTGTVPGAANICAKRS